MSIDVRYVDCLRRNLGILRRKTMIRLLRWARNRIRDILEAGSISRYIG